MRIDTPTARAAIEGDPDALRDLWRSHRRWVAAILMSHMPAEAELDDLLQDVAATVVERVSEVRRPERLKAWLRSVAINAARTAGRKQTVRRRAKRELARGATDHDPAEDRRRHTDDARAAASKVLEMATRLHPDYREPLLLRALNGMSQRAIAATLGVPETTVETRLARARKMLREEMAFDDELGDLAIARPRRARTTKGAPASGAPRSQP